ncbi:MULTISPECIES: Ldh family oxidoreductase [Pandoraea]|uniref:Ldh family oxidoreductase n=1 Tax=Pandoraea TaxID=93217 RepID=UPI001F5C570E|nr:MULTISPECIES: Ldh family oxidoreductase [Pandoraea]MCI3206410.1 lactate dehydrogenase [Pandoraea sp. LA3]MDN4584438.1 lactate dehydrogenase [Pandoraea capi]
MNASPTLDSTRGQSDLPLYDAAALTEHATRLLCATGMEPEKSDAVASTLVEGDLLGHDTHGLAQLAGYLRELQSGSMRGTGEPVVVAERGATLLWDGQRLPGPWLVHKGLDALMPKAREHGVATLVIRRSHHIACLAAYLARASAAGFVLLLATSDPYPPSASVAPFGGRKAVFTPNPFAIGIPSGGDPILVDISASIVTNAMSARMIAQGQTAEQPCWLDAQGEASTDPRVLRQTPPGTILPLGGMASGHKGFGLALLVEALTAALGGFGRADPPQGPGAAVCLTLYDIDAFAGMPEFTRQIDWIIDACVSNPPVPGTARVRMPGHAGQQCKRDQLIRGVRLHPAIAASLAPFESQYGLTFPSALTSHTAGSAGE